MYSPGNVDASSIDLDARWSTTEATRQILTLTEKY
jgi:hypothetical protein